MYLGERSQPFRTLFLQEVLPRVVVAPSFLVSVGDLIVGIVAKSPSASAASIPVSSDTSRRE
jgi:hypothetical protein